MTEIDCNVDEEDYQKGWEEGLEKGKKEGFSKAIQKINRIRKRYANIITDEDIKRLKKKARK